MGEPFGFDARFDVSDACFKFENILDEVHDLDKTLLEGSCDLFMHEEFTSLSCNNDLPNPIDDFHVLPICSLPPLSRKCYIDVPIDNPKSCDSKVDLGHVVKMFNMLGGNVDNSLSLGYSPLTHIAYSYWRSLEKSCGTLSLLSFLIFLWLYLC